MITSLVLLTVACAVAAEERQHSFVLGMDHVMVGVSNLDSATATMENLGFAFKEGRQHDNGILNRHIKFRDGTEVEFLSITAAKDNLAEEYQRSIDQGNGPVFAGLYSPHLELTAERLDSRNVEHFASRSMITFPATSGHRHLFIGTRNLSPTDSANHFDHANGAVRFRGVWIACGDCTAELELMDHLGIFVVGREVTHPKRQAAMAAVLPEGELLYFPEEQQIIPSHPIIGLSLEVDNLDSTRAYLERHSLSAAESDGTLLLSPDHTPGFWLEFRPN